jgi:sugar phosphate isomerase/epimerase
LFADHGVAVCCVDTSCCFHDADEAVRRRSADVALRHADLAAALGAPSIRVFRNEIPPGASRGEVRERVAAGVRSVAERIHPEVAVGLETHGDFAAAEETAAIVRLVDHPAAGIVWDAANTTAAGDTIEAAARAVARHLLHVHLRDAEPRPGQRFWHPVLTGRGRVPLADAVAALRGLGYRGFVAFEWEKLWHPQIEEPGVALGDFADTWRAMCR